jgi:hypothetical protein
MGDFLSFKSGMIGSISPVLVKGISFQGMNTLAGMEELVIIGPVHLSHIFFFEKSPFIIYGNGQEIPDGKEHIYQKAPWKIDVSGHLQPV